MMSITIGTKKVDELPLVVDFIITTTTTTTTVKTGGGTTVDDIDTDDSNTSYEEEMNKYELKDHDNDGEEDTQRMLIGNTVVGANVRNNGKTKPLEETDHDDGDNDKISINNHNSKMRRPKTTNASVKSKIELKSKDAVVTDGGGIPIAKNRQKNIGKGGTRVGIVKMFKSISGRRLRARNNLDSRFITRFERHQLAEDVRNNECGMQKMKSSTSSSSGRRSKFKDRLSQLSTAALAPRTAVDKMIDPENGKENLGFYRKIILAEDDGFDHIK